ncbi:CocE/NonD family hydrolase [Polymorphospora sp. NPDC050346]|uniref:CocE/NonD family hydrolase n=1 Tax=Polymorphospora sp. NPDC050346 TaxID=3155780 RepID=UPI0033CF4626
MFAALAAGLAARLLRLPPARTRRVVRRAGLRVRARDGVKLLTDHYAPDLPAAPTVLIRTPYGRGLPMRVLGRLLAGQGFHVVIQSCRGTFGSGGVFEPFADERADGLDTVDWLRRQRWYSGGFGMFGASYQGFVQWALAPDAGPDLRAMVAVVAASTSRESTYAGGAFSLDSVLTWVELIEAQRVPWLARQVELKRGQPGLVAGLAHLPLAEADRIATGAAVPFFQDWLRHHRPRAAYWRARVFDARITEVTAPVGMITGWHDIFLPAQLADYARLRAAGRRPYLTVGPWTHGSPGLLAASVREGVAWLRAHLAGDAVGLRTAPVRVHVGGGAGWRELPWWPPPAVPVAWHLQPGGGLDPALPPPSAPDRFRYDPADPTPSLGGPLLVAQRAGTVDNRDLEARPDVLTYTGAPLRAPVEVVGPVAAEIRVRSELPYFDVFVRLCDVDRRGRSRNVCDGLVRVAPEGFPTSADGVVAVPVAMWPVAHRFAAGHRLRVQVSGGAHPRYARNPGTGEPLGTAVTLRAGDREIHHDPTHPSAILLPVVEAG